MDEGMLKLIKELRQKEREFRAKADKIETTIKSLQEVFGAQMSLPETEEIGKVTFVPLVQPNLYRGKTIAEAAVMHLKSVGVPQKTREVADGLEAGGAHSSDMYRAVYNALDSSELAHQVEGKRWALREWEGN
jgi:hypothetical protein